MNLPFLKGHGTHNDFVILPDLDQRLDDLDGETVARLCDRRGGIGGDGILRVVRSTGDGDWFMDYRNADGSMAEMCGNGVRVYARYLERAGLVEAANPLRLDTRGGLKTVIFCDDGEISVDMGEPVVGPDVQISLHGQMFSAVSIDMPNPHAVLFVGSVQAVGDLSRSPGYNTRVFPSGVNIEMVERKGPHHVAMRVHERGVGETQSCGTGACAVAVVAADSAGQPRPVEYVVDVPGGRLTIAWTEDNHVHLKGPAEIVAEGTWLG